jgi:hypothetical protein
MVSIVTGSHMVFSLSLLLEVLSARRPVVLTVRLTAWKWRRYADETATECVVHREPDVPPVRGADQEAGLAGVVVLPCPDACDVER